MKVIVGLGPTDLALHIVACEQRHTSVAAIGATAGLAATSTPMPTGTEKFLTKHMVVVEYTTRNKTLPAAQSL